MIIELLCTPVFALINFVISLLPTLYQVPDYMSATLDLLAKALYFFPADVFFVVIGNILTWQFIHLGWISIEWVYRKIPGVD